MSKINTINSVQLFNPETLNVDFSYINTVDIWYVYGQSLSKSV